jgi:hypothetical protein
MAYGCSLSVSTRSIVMAALLGRIGRAHRGLHGDERRRADRTCTAERSDSGRSKAEDGGSRLFCLAM